MTTALEHGMAKTVLSILPTIIDALEHPIVPDVRKVPTIVSVPERPAGHAVKKETMSPGCKPSVLGSIIEQAYVERHDVLMHAAHGDEDVLQDAMVKLVGRSMADLDEACKLITTACKRVRADAGRQAFRLERNLREAALIKVPGADPTVQRVRTAMATLPRKYRDVLTMSTRYNMSEREIADTLGLERGAVSMRMHRARQALKAALTA